MILNAILSCATRFRKAATPLAIFDCNEAKKKRPDHFLIGSLGDLCEFFDLLLCGLEPAIDRAAMNSNPLGKGFDRATLLQVNFNHLLPLCRQVKLCGA